MIKSCFIQLNRFGDLLQTIIIAKEFKNQYPDQEIFLVARSEFTKLLMDQINSVFDNIFLIRSFHDANFSHYNKNQNTLHFFNELKTVIDQLCSLNFDNCFNLTFSKSSSFLTSLIKSKNKFGIHRDYCGRILINDKWSQYLYSVVCSTSYNPYSLIEIYSFIVNIKPLNEPKKVLSNKSIKNIIIHPFASNSEKCLNESVWIEIIKNIMNSSHEISLTILGSEQELKDFKAKLVNQLNRKFNKIGFFSINRNISELNDLITPESIFLGSDSFCGHALAFLNCLTITISLGEVRPHETTPFGYLNLNITHRNIIDRNGPSNIEFNKSLCNFINLIFQNPISFLSQINETDLIDFSQDLIIYQNQFVSSEKKLYLKDLTHNEPNETLVIINFYKLLWDLILKDEDNKLNFPIIDTTLNDKLNSFKYSLEKLYQLWNYYFGHFKNENAKEFNISELAELENKLKLYSPFISPIINYYTLQRLSLKLIEKTNFSLLKVSTWELNQESITSVRILYDLVCKSLSFFQSNNSPKLNVVPLRDN
jgi:ADP-heptose:LPS heptosyltransferase